MSEYKILIIGKYMETEKFSLLNARQIYKPFRYPWAYDAWLKQQQLHWLPQEISMADDIKDWKSVLSDSEKSFITQILRFFTQSDLDVNNCYVLSYLKVFQPVEVRMMCVAFANMETIHMVAYAYLIDTLGLPETEYEIFLEYKEMKDKHDYMQQFDVESKFEIAVTLAAFGAFTEGLQLFASFAMLMNFQRFGKMKGMGQIVAFSVRDETLHTENVIKLFLTFLEENPTLLNDELISKIVGVCRKIVEYEDAFIDSAFDFAGGVIQGMTRDDMKRYIRFIANRRLKQLHLKPIYDVQINPLPWMDDILNAPEHTNFFENRVTEYSKAATSGTWDKAFLD